MATITATIAANTRADIKAARANGGLALPATAKIRVRSHTFAGGSAVIVDVDQVDADWAITTRETALGPARCPTTAAKAAADIIVGILDRQANGRIWGDVTIAGLPVDLGRIKPDTARSCY